MHEIFKKNKEKNKGIDCTEHYETLYQCIKIEKKYNNQYSNNNNINVIYNCNEFKNRYLECLKKVDKF